MTAGGPLKLHLLEWGSYLRLRFESALGIKAVSAVWADSLRNVFRVEIESEWTARKRERVADGCVLPSHCPTQANRALEWATSQGES